MESFSNVTVVKKSNIYFEGKVVSHTVLFEDGTKKTLGIIFPGEYEFGTAAAETMEVVQGELKALLPGETQWKSFVAGEAFYVPANSSFKVAADVVSDYCCSYES